MRLGLIILVHKRHDLVKLGLVLPLLFGIGVFRPDIAIGLHLGNFDARKLLLRIFLLILNGIHHRLLLERTMVRLLQGVGAGGDAGGGLLLLGDAMGGDG